MRRDNLVYAHFARVHVDLAQGGLRTVAEGDVHIATATERLGFGCHVIMPDDNGCTRFCFQARGRIGCSEAHSVTADIRLSTRSRRAAIGAVIGVPEQYIDRARFNAEFFSSAGGKHCRQALAHFCGRDTHLGSRAFPVIRPDFDFSAGLVGCAAAEAGVLVRNGQAPGEAFVAFLPAPAKIFVTHILFDEVDALLQPCTLTQDLAG